MHDFNRHFKNPNKIGFNYVLYFLIKYQYIIGEQ